MTPDTQRDPPADAAVSTEALHKAELLSGLPTLIMLFIAFGAMIAAGIPLILAIAGIATGFASLHLLGMVSPMSVWSMNFSMMIGLAVGIDYSLFIVSRYREERVEGKTAIAAIDAVATIARSQSWPRWCSGLTENASVRPSGEYAG